MMELGNEMSTKENVRETKQYQVNNEKFISIIATSLVIYSDEHANLRYKTIIPDNSDNSPRATNKS